MKYERKNKDVKTGLCLVVEALHELALARSSAIGNSDASNRLAYDPRGLALQV